MRDSNIWHRCLSTNPVCICHYSKILLRSFQQFTGADIAAMSIHAGNCWWASIAIVPLLWISLLDPAASILKHQCVMSVERAANKVESLSLKTLIGKNWHKPVKRCLERNSTYCPHDSTAVSRSQSSSQSYRPMQKGRKSQEIPTG